VPVELEPSEGRVSSEPVRNSEAARSGPEADDAAPRDFEAACDTLLADAVGAFASASDADALEACRVAFLGAKSGRLKGVQKLLGTVGQAHRPAAGRRFNEVKEAVLTAAEAARGRLSGESDGLAAIDVTLPGTVRRLGHVHPVTDTIRRLQEIMARLGFESVEGPEVEDQWHNFEALAIPADHPARDPLDNFYVAVARGSEPLLLRSQTSTVQIRVMESRKPPVRIVSLGRVYRPDTADATHYPMFHQVEGLCVEPRNPQTGRPGVTMAHLKTTLRYLASSFLGGDVPVRFRPSFFPFTEPSVEVDMEWGERWVEMGGAGMVDPAVLEAVGYDPEVVSGFAFGLGVERIAARRHGVADIRDFTRNDVRFLSQF
jgi:phenylalanyl-tRNA synthetase alpha chain